MNINCSACGYESPSSARFCRQCGVQISAPDVTEATTRNFGRQYAQPTGTRESTVLNANPGDATGNMPDRYASAQQTDYVPPAQYPAARKTSSLRPLRRVLKWGGFVLALIMSAGMGAAINEISYSDYIRLTGDEMANLKDYRLKRELAGETVGVVTDAQERAVDDLERRIDDIERSRRDAERARRRGNVPPGDIEALVLDSFIYPGKITSEGSNIPGSELAILKTNDSFDTVLKFYVQKLGQPIIQTVERNERKAVFQSPESPEITVLVREGRGRSAQPEITIVRSPFRLFPLNAEQKTDGPVAPPPPAVTSQKAMP